MRLYLVHLRVDLIIYLNKGYIFYMPTVFDNILAHRWDAVERYIDNDGDLRVKDQYGQTILLVVLNVQTYSEEDVNYPSRLVMKLLDLNVNIKGRIVIGVGEDYIYTKNGTALHAAYFHRADDDTQHVFLRLLNHPDTDVNATCDVDPTSDELFINDPPNALNQESDNCYLENATVLHFAAAQGRIDMVTAILNSGKAQTNALANLVSNKNWFYDETYHIELGDAFKNKFQSNHSLSSSQKPIFNVEEHDDKTIYGDLALCFTSTFRDTVHVSRLGLMTPLHLAAQGDFNPIMRLLKTHGANIEARDSDHKTPAHYLKNIPAFLYEDSDSEEEDNYVHVPERVRIKTISSSSPRQSIPTPAFVEYRGLHFYKNVMPQNERRKWITFQKLQTAGLQQMGIHSCASYDQSQVSYELPDLSQIKASKPETLIALNNELNRRDHTLEQQSIIIRGTLANLGVKRPTNASLGSSRKLFDSCLDELIQRYVNSYQSFVDELKQAPGQKSDGRSTEKTRQKWGLLKDLGVSKLPFVSTTDDPNWSLEYATALVNYEKKDTFAPREGKNAQPLTPNYKPNGRPQHPYLGLVYISVHPVATTSENSSVHIPTLFAHGRIDTKCAAPNGHELSGYVRARERTFFGYIPKEEVKYFTMIRLPNFDKTEYPVYFQEKYGINAQQFHYYKEKLSTYGAVVDTKKGTMRNINQFHRIAFQIIQQVIQHKERELMENANLLAQNSGNQVAFINADNQLVTELPEMSSFVSKR
jgi:hypothetical protein